MNTGFEKDLRGIPLRPVPAEWRTRILAKATPQARHPVLSAFLWPHPAFWLSVVTAWAVVVVLTATGPRGKALYAFGGEDSGSKRISPEAYAFYRKQCAAIALHKLGPNGPPRRSEL